MKSAVCCLLICVFAAFGLSTGEDMAGRGHFRMGQESMGYHPTGYSGMRRGQQAAFGGRARRGLPLDLGGASPLSTTSTSTLTDKIKDFSANVPDISQVHRQPTVSGISDKLNFKPPVGPPPKIPPISPPPGPGSRRRRRQSFVNRPSPHQGQYIPFPYRRF